MKERHHRRCRSNGGTNEKSNISMVTKNQHRAWHTLFQNLSAFQIAKIINEVWLDTQWEMKVIPRGSEGRIIDEIGD